MDGAPNQTHTNSCTLGEYEEGFMLSEVYILISVLGITFNAFVLIILCINKKPCTVPEIYLSNLAAADLILMCCLLVEAVVVFSDFNWPFGSFLCKVYNQVFDMNYPCSIYFLVMVSIDRYLAVVHPLSCQKIREPLHAKFGCFMIWTLGFLLSITTFIYSETIPNNNVTSCALMIPSLTVLLTIESNFFVLTFILPISISSFCTVMIVKTLRHRLPEGLNVQQTDRKATTLILVVFIAFLICWLPLHLNKIGLLLFKVNYLTECKSFKILFICQQLFLYLAFFNCVLNPILYVIVGKNFRRKITELYK